MVEGQKLTLVPVFLTEAFRWINETHRHHRAPIGGLFAVGIAQGDDLKGVAIVGRPVSRHLDDGWTVEVTRVAVIEDVSNACSMLYGAAWRAARAMGYKKAITYILKEERGTSVKAAGWTCIGEAGGGSWSVQSRPRVDKHPLQTKLRWEIDR